MKIPRYSFKNVAILLSLLVLLGVGIRLHFAFEKQYFHIDGIYSHELINSNSWAKQRTNLDNYNKVISGNVFEPDMVISKNEKFNYNFNNVLKYDDIHPPLFYWLLHPMQVIISNGQVSWWPGIILNLFCYIVTSLFLFKLARIFFTNQYYALFPVALFAFSPAMISMALFVRMYCLLGVFIVAFSYYALKIIQKRHPSKTLYLKFTISCLLGALTHHYFLPLAVLWFFIATFYIIKCKHYTKLQELTFCSVLCANIYLLIWPVVFDQIFFSQMGKFVLSTIGKHGRFFAYLQLTNSHLFNQMASLFFATFLVTVLFTNIKKLKNNNCQVKLNYLTPLLTIYAIMTGLIIETLAFWAYRYFFIPNIFLLFCTSILFIYAIDTIKIKQTTKYLAIATSLIVFCYNFNHYDIKYTYSHYTQPGTNLFNLKYKQDTPVIIRLRTRQDKFVFTKKQKDWMLTDLMPYLHNKKQVYIIDDKYFNTKNAQQILQSLGNPYDIFLIEPFKEIGATSEIFDNIYPHRQADQHLQYHQIFYYSKQPRIFEIPTYNYNI